MAGFIIVGGGMAAGTAARTLRTEGFTGPVTVITEEPHPPYQRPPLSKGYLRGKEGLDKVILKPADWYAEHDIDLRTGTAVTRVDPIARTVTLDDGTTLEYDKLLLATGASPRALSIPGAQLPGVHTLRRLEDADALAAELRQGGKRLVLIGSGWIGMEVAATARQLGNAVVVLERDPVPLAAAVGVEMGEMFRGLHRDNGVDIRTSVTVERIVGTDRAEGVVVDGETIPADLVLIGVGAVPNTTLAERADLDVLNGIRVDSALRASAPDVYAAGDVANAFHPVLQRHLRSEHWQNARVGGRVAAKSMLGQDVALRDIPYFYTDQFDVGMELSGYAPLMAEAELVVRGDLDRREFIAFWLDHGRVVGGMNVNVWDVNKTVQELIRSGVRVDVSKLRDESVPLESLLEE